ncbi:MAG: hypothetical protein M4579_004432 [Chaenotheca gracillima]|nr:MAG: hypothetical protein M4579_004432 [Chaenotheca gracillima]
MTSTGHEIGVLFGFVAAIIVCGLAYWVVWVMANKRSARKEIDRRAALTEQGIGEKATIRDRPELEHQNGALHGDHNV